MSCLSSTALEKLRILMLLLLDSERLTAVQTNANIGQQNAERHSSTGSLISTLKHEIYHAPELCEACSDFHIYASYAVKCIHHK